MTKRTYVRLPADEHELLAYMATCNGQCRGEYLKTVVQRHIYQQTVLFGPFYEKQQEIIERRMKEILDGGNR